MKIRTRIWLIMGILLALVCGIFAYDMNKLNQDNKMLHLIKDQELTYTVHAQDMQMALKNYEVQRLIAGMGLVQGDSAMIEQEQRFRKSLNDYAQLNPSDSKRIEAIRNNFDKFINAKAQDESGKLVALIEEEVQKISRGNVDNIQASLAEIVNMSEKTSRVFSVLAVLIVILGLACTYLLTASIIKPVKALIRQSTVIARGDLSQTILSKSKDEIGELSRNFEAMRGSLAEFIQSSQITAYQVAASTEQLKESTSQTSHSILEMADMLRSISKGTNDQMLSTVETARAMEDLSRGIQRVSELTGHVAEESMKSEQEAQQGNRILESAVSQMDQLSIVIRQFYETVSKLDAHSASITQMMDVIKSVASQTNLLSLNAGIEAARAGEHGKGFAVVAGEIRKLSDQANTSSTHIYEIIRQIQEDTRSAVSTVESGAAHAEESIGTIRSAREAFKKITQATGEISQQIQEISAAAEEMTASSEEISATVHELSSIAKDAHTKCDNMSNAAQEQLQAIREIAGASVELDTSAGELQGKIRRFKV